MQYVCKKTKGRSDGGPISFDTDIRKRNGRWGFHCRTTRLGCQTGEPQLFTSTSGRFSMKSVFPKAKTLRTFFWRLSHG